MDAVVSMCPKRTSWLLIFEYGGNRGAAELHVRISCKI